MEGDLTWGGEHTIQYTDDVLQNCTPEIYIILLTNVTPINVINFFLRILFFKLLLKSKSIQLSSGQEAPPQLKGLQPAIPLLGLYPKNPETPIQKNRCSPMFIEAQFTIAKYWKQPKCPSATEWIKKLWYIYTMEFYAAERKNSYPL